MRTAFPILRGSVLTSLAAGLLLSIGCSQDDPFKDLREKDKSSDGDSEGKDTGTQGKSTKTSGGDSGAKDQTKDKPQGTGSTSGANVATNNSNAVRTDQTGTGAANTDAGGSTPNANCKSLPGQMVVLGDFTPAGRDPIDGPNDAKNGFKIVHEHLKRKYSRPSLVYKNYASPTSLFKELAETQMKSAPTGTSSPTLVLIHSGSNDLAEFITKSSSAAETAFPTRWAESKTTLDNLVAHFNDKTKFPGGATILINTLYNPFDDCKTTIVPIFAVMDETKTRLMGQFNTNLKNYAKGVDNMHFVDLHGPFLGHGRNHENQNCASYKPNADIWLKGGTYTLGGDKTVLTDLNVKGHAKVGELINAKLDALFSGC